MIADFGAGAMLGLSIALPFGPVSLVCVQQSVVDGWRAGVLASAGASTAHAVYAVAAIAGAGVAVEIAPWRGSVHLASAAILVVLGLRACLRRPSLTGAEAAPVRRAAFASSLTIALCNPLTLLPYLAVAAGSAAAETQASSFSSWSILGVIIGVAAWYACLTVIASCLRARLSPRLLQRLNVVSGVVLIGFGASIAIR